MEIESLIKKTQLAAYCGHEAAKLVVDWHQSDGDTCKIDPCPECDECQLMSSLQDWISGLSHWGQATMVRAAVAAAWVAHNTMGWGQEFRQSRKAIEAAESWLADPSEENGEVCYVLLYSDDSWPVWIQGLLEAITGEWGPRPSASHGRSIRHATQGAARLAGVPAVRAAIRSALTSWALVPPVRDNLDPEEREVFDKMRERFGMIPEPLPSDAVPDSPSFTPDAFVEFKERGFERKVDTCHTAPQVAEDWVEELFSQSVGSSANFTAAPGVGPSNTITLSEAGTDSEPVPDSLERDKVIARVVGERDEARAEVKQIYTRAIKAEIRASAFELEASVIPTLDKRLTSQQAAAKRARDERDDARNQLFLCGVAANKAQNALNEIRAEQLKARAEVENLGEVISTLTESLSRCVNDRNALRSDAEALAIEIEHIRSCVETELVKMEGCDSDGSATYGTARAFAFWILNEIIPKKPTRVKP